MKIDNEFTVSVPVDKAWEVLTDLAGVSLCLPGAQLTGVEGGVFSGEIRVKVGPVVSEYAGTAQFAERDDAAYRAVIDAKGRDSRGAGNASALITMQLKPDGVHGDHTVVSVDTDMKISGKIAQLGGGMIREVSQKLLGQFVDCLEARLATPAPASDLSASAPAATEMSSATTESTPSEFTPASSASEPTPMAEPTPVAAASEPGSGSTSGAAPLTAEPVSTPASSAAWAAPAAPSGSPEPLDLMSVAAGAMLKRLVPVLLVAAAVVAVVVYLIVR